MASRGPAPWAGTKLMKRRHLIQCCLAGSCVLTGCLGVEEEDDPDGSVRDDTDPMDDGDENDDIGVEQEDADPEEATDESDDDPPDDDGIDALEPVEFTGSGSEVAEDIELGEGIVVAEAEETDADEMMSFSAALIDTEGGQEWRLFHFRENIDEPIEGAAVVDEGAYHLEVDSTGDWTIELWQPRPHEDEAEEPPFELEGRYDTVEGPFAFDGVEVMTGIHDGELDFTVTVWPMEGPWTDFDIPIMESGEGEFEGTLAFGGIAYLQIEADRAWTVSVE